MSENEWIKSKAQFNPQFKFWNTALQLELLALIFIRSIREGNFRLYIESISKILPWFFALDHVHYARWLSVHLRDMATLHLTHPDMATEFNDGKFVVHKTKKAFSAIATDQALMMMSRHLKTMQANNS